MIGTANKSDFDRFNTRVQTGHPFYFCTFLINHLVYAKENNTQLHLLKSQSYLVQGNYIQIVPKTTDVMTSSIIMMTISELNITSAGRVLVLVHINFLLALIIKCICIAKCQMHLESLSVLFIKSLSLTVKMVEKNIFKISFQIGFNKK